ncbi:MAG TPA: methyl-accepting chemotaxis protein [Ktedonobacteraceae bacterium]|nr:methyl-accepting chemotaxis protein [Ktedonobacteraceae bacterium]
MTVSTLLRFGLVASTAIPVAVIAVLGFIATAQITGNAATTFVLSVVACAIIVLLAVLSINYVIQRRIQDRLLGLVDVCRDYAGGDRTVRAAVSGDDEFAMLSMSLNTLLDSQGTPAQSGTSYSSGSGDASALQAQIEKLLQEVSAVGDGDLRVQAEVTPDTLGVLADSFNYMIEELAKVVGRVQSTAVQVTNATRRILDGSAELAQASETQVAQISQTTEAVEALAIFIQNVARNAQLSADVAQEALHHANNGQQSVRQTIDGMMLIRENVQETSKKIKRLGERSNEIGEIVRIIEDIADQTNLLALNAAIQSAMAGEHGRGFAVVADEIRLLAERSTESTKRIDTLVKSIQGDTYEAVVAMEDSTQEVVKGSQLADEAGHALNSIYNAVERQAQMIESIARAANDQTSVSEAVAVAMGQISEITRQTNFGTQEAAASVTYLAELADQLRSSVSTFRLPDRGNDMLGTFPGMTSVTELGNGNQFYPPALPSGAGNANEWGQNFNGTFPPLPERGNSSGSLVAMTTRNGNGQFGSSNQQDFASQPGFSSQPFGSSPNFGNQSGFGDQQGFNGQSPFSNQGGFEGQPGFGGQSQAPFGNQGSYESQSGFGGPSPAPFGNQGGFESQPGFGGQPQAPFGSQGGYESQQGFDNQGSYHSQGGFGEFGGFEGQQEFGGGQGQSFFPPTGQAPHSQSANSGPLQQKQPGYPQAPRPRRPANFGNPGNSQQQSFGQDQTPFPGNGQFGQ